MTTIWSILGIEPTQDKQQIKKAYAKKLRMAHPENDPRGYQRLREAFDAAIKQAGMPEEHDFPGYGQDLKTGVAIGTKQEGEPAPDSLALFEQHLHELYTDFKRRVDPQEWKMLANQDYIWDVGAQGERFDALIRFLDEHRHMPANVWKVLDELFLIRENFEHGYDYFDDELMEFVTGQISGGLAMGYECFLNRELAIDLEAYLGLRQEAQLSLMDGRLEDAGRELAAAHALFREDPDLELMRAKHAIMAGDSGAALAVLHQVVRLNPEAREAYLLRGRLLFDRRQYREALQDADYLLQFSPTPQDAYCLALECREVLGQVEQAWEDGRKRWEFERNSIHYRFYAVWSRFKNRHLFPQKYSRLPFKVRLRMWQFELLMMLFLFLGLNWLYILLYLVCRFTFGAGSAIAAIWLAVMLWNTWKTAKIAWMRRI